MKATFLHETKTVVVAYDDGRHVEFNPSGLSVVVTTILDDAFVEISDLRARLEKAERDAALMASVQRAAKELPTGWQIELVVEADSGWVQLRKPDGDFLQFNDSDLELDEQVSAAIDAAIAKERT